MARKTREDALVTRERLLDAAEFLFDAQGVASTSLQDIASHAGTTRGAVYWHFRDKAELLDTLLTQRALQPLQQMAQALEQQHRAESPLARLCCILFGLVDGIAASDSIWRVMGIAILKVERGVGVMQLLGRRRSEGMGEFREFIRLTLTEAGACGALRAQGPPWSSAEIERASRALADIFDGLLTGCLLGGAAGAAELPAQMRHVVSTYLKGLGLELTEVADVG